MLSGRVFARADLRDADTLTVIPDSSKQTLNWRDQPNVFKQARALGVNAALVGWHHPYCRVLGDSLVRCLDEVGGHPTAGLLREINATEDGVLKTVGLLFRLQGANIAEMFRNTGLSTSENLNESSVQRRQLQQYFRIRDRAYADATDPRIGLLFIHFPLPHLFAIYDRRTRDFTLSSSTSYFDNLALADRTFAELRRALEQAGLWESTSLLITADHGLRPELWRGRYNWNDELERLTANGPSLTVPFIVKLAGHNEGLTYDKPFSNVVSSALVLAMLTGQVSTGHDAIEWLEAHTQGREITSRPAARVLASSATD